MVTHVQDESEGRTGEAPGGLDSTRTRSGYKMASSNRRKYRSSFTTPRRPYGPPVPVRPRLWVRSGERDSSKEV